MKINFSFAKTKKIHRVTRAKVREYINPRREWALGLFGATLCLLAGATYIGIDLRAQFTDELVFTGVNETTLTYNKTDVIEQATLFREKDKRFNELRAEWQTLPEPVIPQKIEEPLPSVEEIDGAVPENVLLQ